MSRDGEYLCLSVGVVMVANGPGERYERVDGSQETGPILISEGGIGHDAPVAAELVCWSVV